jgi:hypothetical protein
MMRANHNGSTKTQLLLSDQWFREVCGLVSSHDAALIVPVHALTAGWNSTFSALRRRVIQATGCFRSLSSISSKTLAFAALIVFGLAVGPDLRGQDVNIQQAAGGIAIGGTKNNRRSGFGNVNGLGIGTPVAGATIIAVTGGVLYSSPINLQVNGAGAGNPAVVGVRVSNNFAHSLLLQAFSCISGCTSAANYSAISLNPASMANDTPVIPSPGMSTNQTITVFVAVFVSNQDGALAFTGTDSVQLTYDTYNGANGQLRNTDTLTLNNPSENLQTAVQMTLGTAAGGLTISPATDYAANYGNVNGLGIGPGSGLSTVSVAGGTVYSTPYLINPEFSDFSSTTATIKVALTTNFAHPTVLQLEDSASSGGPFTQITVTPLTITGSAGSFSSITRYLGLFVSSSNNGAGAFTGADTATLTFTMTVP